ncbi:hypothetical protein AtEden1_Chr4g0272671 [Arabidopsis thaliana]
MNEETYQRAVGRVVNFLGVENRSGDFLRDPNTHSLQNRQEKNDRT